METIGTVVFLIKGAKENVPVHQVLSISANVARQHGYPRSNMDGVKARLSVFYKDIATDLGAISFKINLN